MYLVRKISLFSRLLSATVFSAVLMTGSALAADDDVVNGCTPCGGTKPLISFQEPANISDTSFDARFIINSMGAQTAVVLSYSIDPNFASSGTTPEQIFTNNTDDEAQSSITNLPTGAIIYYYATATNANGSTVTATETVQLSGGSILTLPVTNIGSTTATFNGRFQSNGLPFGAGFVFGKQNDPNLVEVSSSFSGSLDPSNISFDVGALKPDTTYAVRFSAGQEGDNDVQSQSQDGEGLSGDEVTFKTTPPESGTANSSTSPGTSSSTPSNPQQVVTTITRLAVGVKSALFRSGKKIHFVLDATATGEVALRVVRLNPKRHPASCKRVSVRDWIKRQNRSADCKVVLFPTSAHMKVRAGSNKLTYKPLRPLTPGTYRATFRVVGDNSATSIKFKVRAKK